MPPPKNILFVSERDNCRSVMAQRLFGKMAATRGIGTQASSAGTAAAEGYGVTFEAQEILLQRGMDASGHVTRGINAEMVEAADLICPMEREQETWLKKRFPGSSGKIRTLASFCDAEELSGAEDISHPPGQESSFYPKLFDQIHVCIRAVLRSLKMI